MQNRVISSIRFRRRVYRVRYQHIIRQSKRAIEAFRASSKHSKRAIEQSWRGGIPPMLASAPSGGGASEAAKSGIQLPIYWEFSLPIGEGVVVMLTF